MDNKGRIKIIIAEDNQPFLQALSFLISEQAILHLTDTCSNGVDLLNSTKLHSADLLFIDIDMPKLNGIEAAKLINFEYPEKKMIAITMYQESVYLTELIKVGFKAFIYKPEIHKILKETIQMVMENKFSFPNNINII